MTTPDAPDDPNAAAPTPDATTHEDAEDRAAILRRRAVFIASAIAGLGVVSCSGDPRPCLDVYVPPDPDAGAADDAGDPVPCLSVALPPPTVDLDAGAPPDATPPPTPSPDAGDGGDPMPRPCLKVAPRPSPQPCLSQLPPDPKKP